MNWSNGLRNGCSLFTQKKSHVLTLGKFYNITHTEVYTLHHQELQHVFEQKDLGAILDAELKLEKSKT